MGNKKIRRALQHNYQVKLVRLLAAGKIKFKPNQIAEVGIYHDDYCRIWKGGLCNCDPDIRVMQPS